ncbi:MAG: hypothetical protein ACAI35_09025 [Candidatus Methylacidiphilales bacterium]|nr:hypothetical protein [Candidatus Methylacidiphilales bacterium]
MRALFGASFTFLPGSVFMGKIKDYHDPQLLNVDLEVISGTPFKALPECWGKNVFFLYNGEHREGKFLAAAEVSVTSRDADAIINQFCDLIEQHNPEAAGEWQNAESRTLDIGIESGLSRKVRCEIFKINLKPETIVRTTSHCISIAVSVYPLRIKKKGSKSLRLMYPD